MRELLFSVTRKDFTIVAFKPSKGPGGQKQNKTSSGCRVEHKPSGSRAESTESRSFHENRKIAWRKVVDSVKFRVWLAERRAEAMGRESIKQQVGREMADPNLRVEVRKDGRWEIARSYHNGSELGL